MVIFLKIVSEELFSRIKVRSCPKGPEPTLPVCVRGAAQTLGAAAVTSEVKGRGVERLAGILALREGVLLSFKLNYIAPLTG